MIVIPLRSGFSLYENGVPVDNMKVIVGMAPASRIFCRPR